MIIPLFFLCVFFQPADAGDNLLPKIAVDSIGDLLSTTPKQQDVFGISTLTDGKNIFIGAPWDNDAAYRAGALYVYGKSGDQWGQLKKITQDNPSPRSMFGSSVDVTEKYIAIGAAAESRETTYNTGSVYIYDRSNYNFVAKLLLKTSKSGDFFGNAVIWLDDKTLAVGAHLSDARGVDSGCVYIFNQQKDGTWKEIQALVPKALHTGSLFGNSLATSGDFLAVGAYGQNGKLNPGAGAVFVFKKDTHNKWQEFQTLQPNTTKSFTEFGDSIGMQGKTLVVGTPYEDSIGRKLGVVYSFVFNDVTNKWTLHQKVTNDDKDWQGRFGGSVALNNNRLFVGAPFGVVYAYGQERYDTPWQFSTKITKTIPDYQNMFVQTLSVLGDTLVIGVPLRQSSDIQSGTAHVVKLK